MPKGVLWRQEEILLAALLPPRSNRHSRPLFRAREGGAGKMRAMPTPPFMHGAAHWAAFTMWHVGGTIFVQSDPRTFDAVDIWGTVERERVSAMTIVGDAFARPMLDALREGDFDVSSVRSISSGGAILTANVKDELLAALPGAESWTCWDPPRAGTRPPRSPDRGRKPLRGISSWGKAMRS